MTTFCGHPMGQTDRFIVIRPVDTSPWLGYECRLCGSQWKRTLPPMTGAAFAERQRGAAHLDHSTAYSIYEHIGRVPRN